VGWRRQRGGKWQAVCDGATEREAWERLADLMNKVRSGSFDNLILPRGEQP